MKQKARLIYCIIAIAMLLPCIAAAETISIGEPVDGDSWVIDIYFPFPINHAATELEAFIINEDPGYAPADWINIFGIYQKVGSSDPWTDIGWTSTVVDPDYLYGTGPALDPSQQLQIHWGFTGHWSDQWFDVHWFWNDEAGNNLTRGQFQNHGGGFLAFFDPNLDVNDPMYNRAVPEPATLLLLGTGLVGIGVARRRMKG